MLQKLSDGAKGGFSKFILVGFLFMAVAGLVLTDVGGFFRDGVSSTSVADVGRDSVPYHEFDRFARSMLARQGISPQDAYMTGQMQELVNRYAQDILFVQAASDLGIYVPKKEIAAQLHRFVEPYTEGGAIPAQDALNRLLAQQGISEADFVGALRRDMTNNVLQSALASGVTTRPTALSQALVRYQNESRDIEYVVFPSADIKVETAPNEEEMRGFYEASRMEYRIPERRGFTIALLDPKNLIQSVEISDEEARAYYDSNITNYQVPAGLEIEQAILSSEDEANTVLTAVQNGTSLEEAAGDAYRGEQIIDPENAPAALAEILNLETEDDLRGPVQSPLGWHVIRIIGDAPERTRDFAEVKNTIIETLKRDAENDLLFETIDSVNDQIDEGTSIASLSDTYKMESLSLEPVDSFGLKADNSEGLISFEADRASILEILFNLYENEISEMIELADGRFAILKIDTILPEDFKSFESVKDGIQQRLIQNQQRAQNQARVQEAFSALSAGDMTLGDVGTVARAPNICRSQTEFETKDLSVNVRMQIFDRPVGEFVLTQMADGYIIVRTTGRSIEDVGEIKETAATDFENLEAVQILSSYFSHLERETPIKINQSLLERLYGPAQN